MAFAKHYARELKFIRQHFQTKDDPYVIENVSKADWEAYLSSECNCPSLNTLHYSSAGVLVVEMGSLQHELTVSRFNNNFVLASGDPEQVHFIHYGMFKTRTPDGRAMQCDSTYGPKPVNIFFLFEILCC